MFCAFLVVNKKTGFIFKIFLSATFLALSSFTLPLLQDTDTNAKLKATYIRTFIRNIDWPESYKDGDFVIGVLGNSNITQKLNEMAASQKADNQQFSIVKFDNVSAISKCHILIIPTEASADLPQVQNKLKNSSTLIVTDKPGLVRQGSGINFIIQNYKIEFELNKTIIEKQNLKLSTQFPKFAVAVF
jgi:hypothetical protein